MRSRNAERSRAVAVRAKSGWRRTKNMRLGWELARFSRPSIKKVQSRRPLRSLARATATSGLALRKPSKHWEFRSSARPSAEANRDAVNLLLKAKC